MLRKRTGFTLIELLVVIAIIAILAAILFPVFARAKQTAMRSSCAQNMKQLNLAVIAYADDYNQRLPNASWMCKVWTSIYGYADKSKGPFILDLLDKYIKNRGIWMCPAVKPAQPLPNWEGSSANFSAYTWNNNGGMPGGRLVNVPTNYCWNHLAHGDGTKSFPVSGSLVSEMVRPTYAMMFIEMPYWTDNCPHTSGTQRGVNMVFYDGHTKLIQHKENMDAYYEWCWKGWFRQ